jgi:uncharacterized membrane protein YraQ (UPF0718 family)
MSHFIGGVVWQCWQILLEAAPYVLFGFFMAGLLKALVPSDLVTRHLGRNSPGAVLKAALFGAPLPLCSCSVIPAAIGLRRQGASKGAAASFLVSVPETGVDSIAISWALLGPFMALARPVVAFVTATLTGLLINLLPEEPLPAEQPSAAECSCPSLGAVTGAPPQKEPLRRRLRAGMAFAFGDLLGDIGKWLLFGILVAGVISHLLPADLLTRVFAHDGLSFLAMLLVGIPLYICASASTPIAAILMAKGLSPGAALVFLLAGPATNAATLTLVLRYFGRRATVVYLLSIALCALLAGYLLNRIYAAGGFELLQVPVSDDPGRIPWLSMLAALLLLLLIGRSLLPRNKKKSCC